MINVKEVTDQLKIDEGFRDKIYQCSANKNTIGYGFNLDANKLPEPIAEQLLIHGILQCMEELSNYGWYNALDTNRQGAIVNMCFNIGLPSLLKFKNMIAAIKDGDYELAAIEMKESKWFKQVGDRAVRLIRVMRWG